MIVDDSRLQRRLLRSALQAERYEIVEADSAERAMELCEEDLPDIVLSDWIMSGQTGLDLCRAIRAKERDNYVYFIVLTSKSEKGELAKALREGADDFLSKPVSAEELRGRLSAGERLLAIERQLVAKNRMVTDTLQVMRSLNESLNRDLIEARKLQMSLVPRRTTEFPGGSVSYMLQSSGHVGGDLVGEFRFAEDRMGVFSLDVSGHGIASALITARLSASLSGNIPGQNVALQQDGDRLTMLRPSEICERLNTMFIQEIDTEHYFTIVIGEIDLKTRKMIFCQAGHPHPAVIDTDGRTRFVGGGGMPVGLIENATYEDFELDLAPGERLLLYSDGLTECPHPDGGMLDEDGLSDMIQRQHTRTGARFLDALKWELSRLVDDRDLPDDVSAAVIAFHAPD
ncbi:SpoIIE family protein phosphatase [Maribius pontilimi]|uniref:SpoIIE family protein phosphatase n=2 Tax=Palleronia pontilimi TaxID=1964209 RepID=A0A934IGQ7_9RHOB|nr:SpoIIE family protein phosphatase [Palleronia pontilimi]